LLVFFAPQAVLRGLSSRSGTTPCVLLTEAAGDYDLVGHVVA